MRVLMIAAPFPEHVFPLVPLAWEFRSAGHDVLVATAGEAVRVADAGLPVANVARHFDLRRVRRRVAVRNPLLLRAERAGRAGPRGTATLFGEINDEMADGAVALADEWAPDLVVHEALAPVGAVVAARHRVPAALCDQTFFDGQYLDFAHTGHLSYVCGRHGVDVPAPPAAVIHLAPPSMVGARPGWRTRHVPYDDGQITRADPGPPRRPRIVVARSTPAGPGDALTRAAIRAAGRVDAEVVLLRPHLGNGRLPGNVRVVEWTSLSTLLRHCSGLIHHGGSATVLAALAAGVPQLVVPDGGDRHHNARRVRERGVGLVGDVKPALLRRLLTDETLTAAAADVRAELAGAPGPEEIAARLIRLVERAQAGPTPGRQRSPHPPGRRGTGSTSTAGSRTAALPTES